LEDARKGFSLTIELLDSASTNDDKSDPDNLFLAVLDFFNHHGELTLSQAEEGEEMNRTHSALGRGKQLIRRMAAIEVSCTNGSLQPASGGVFRLKPLYQRKAFFFEVKACPLNC